jgi:hypothetical protein
MCEGVCVSFSGGDMLTMCTNRCVLGGELETTNDCGGLDQGLCVFRPTGYGAGDQGFCAQPCSVQTDCNNPDWWCFSNDYAPQGFCFGTDPCPNGQGDCDPQSGTTCTTTQHGDFCLDPVIPLGEGGGSSSSSSSASGTGGAGGAGGQGGQGG